MKRLAVLVWLAIVASPPALGQTIPNLPQAASVSSADLIAIDQSVATSISANGRKTYSASLSEIVGVPISCTPATGYVPIATGAATACWQDVPFRMGGYATNPYTFVTPPGNVYADYKPLATTQIYLPNGALAINNKLAYGNLSTATASSFTLNSNRPACVNGYTADNQISSIQEVGAIALCSQIDTLPYLFSAGGTFTSTTFVPTTNLATVNVTYPFGGTGTATEQSLLQPNMWLITNDTIPLYGRITNVGTGGSITVSGWYALGNGAAGQVPSGTLIYVNPQNFFWALQSNLFLNELGKSIAGTFTAPTGTVTNGSKVITSVSDTTGVMVGQLISATSVPAGSAITAYTSNSITINQNATGTPGSPVSLTISTHPGNYALHWEPDIFNYGPAFSPLTPVKVTGCTATMGSNTLTGCTTIPATIRWGHTIYPSDATKVPAGATVIATPSTTSVTLNQQALASGSVDITFFSSFYEGGVGIHLACVLTSQCNTAYEASGSWAYNYFSHGAGDTAFLLRPDGFSALPSYGFRVDRSVGGGASTCDFALTQPGATLWCINDAGTEFVQSIFASAFGFGVTPIWLATAPTIASGFCAASPSIAASNGVAAFDINVGTACAGSTGTLTMPSATTAWACKFSDVTTPASYIIDQTGGSTTTVTLTAYSRTTGAASTFTASDHIRGSCAAY